MTLINLHPGLRLRKVSKFGVPAGSATLPEDASIPYTWVIATLWYRLTEDAGKEFEQRLQVVQPDGNVVIEGIVPFPINSPHTPQ